MISGQDVAGQNSRLTSCGGIGESKHVINGENVAGQESMTY
jgi:hypothetical protein